MQAILVLYYTLFISSALAFGLASTVVDNCEAYPAISSYLANCKTATPFCESLLGRGPETMTQTYSTYTKTVPKTIVHQQVTTKTVTARTTVPFYTAYTTATVLECATTATPDALLDIAGVTATPEAAAFGKSCGVGHYSSAWVSTACSCEIDSTIIIATTTKTKKMGTAISMTTLTPTSYITLTSYMATTLATTTRYDANCFPPANASCLYPALCTDPFYFSWKCGSGSGGPGFDCICGQDSHNMNSCYDSQFTCATAPTCTYDYDCADGYFCLQQGFDRTADCCKNVCVKADVCINDQPSGSGTSSVAVEATIGVVNTVVH